MNVKYLVLGLVFIICFFRYLLLRYLGRKANFLFVSSFIQLLPFGYHFLTISDLTEEGVLCGAFGSTLAIELSTFITILLILSLALKRKSVSKKSYSINIYLFFLFLSAITFVNPHNNFILGVFVPLSVITQLLLFLVVLEPNITKEQVLKGLFEGLLIVTGIQLILTLMFPILNIESITTMFRGEESLIFASRERGNSAIGTFEHPGQLALFCSLSAIFFLTTYLNKYRYKLSGLLVILNLIIVIFTFSRTSILASLFSIVIIIFVFKKTQSLFNAKNIFKIFFALIFVILLLSLTPLLDVFIYTDASDQFTNRMIHFLLVPEFMKVSPWIGVGLNSHVTYMSNHFNIVQAAEEVGDFFVLNPIHNIHLIILVETGILGFVYWLYLLFSRIKNGILYSKTSDITSNIFNLSFSGMLLVFFLYGMTGWAGGRFEIYSLILAVGYFSEPKH